LSRLRMHIMYLANAQTYLRCRWQNVPYVKCMVNGLVALNGACDQAVHNKERCLSLSAYAAPSRGRSALALRSDSL
jgi:hypothetical protein